MSRQTHFSTMAAAVVPWLPWCHPACAENTTTNQDHQPSFLPIKDTLDRDGMPLVRYRRTQWFGVSNGSFVRELLEVVSILPKQNDSSGTKATWELVDPWAIYPHELRLIYLKRDIDFLAGRFDGRKIRSKNFKIYFQSSPSFFVVFVLTFLLLERLLSENAVVGNLAGRFWSIPRKNSSLVPRCM
jgi:hypothetical protein